MKTEKKSLPTPGLFPVRERVLTFRVTFDQLDQLKRTAKSNGTTVSTIIRELVHGHDNNGETR
jgi:predicted DNA binding CopG/RHH family protein